MLHGALIMLQSICYKHSLMYAKIYKIRLKHFKDKSNKMLSYRRETALQGAL